VGDGAHIVAADLAPDNIAIVHLAIAAIAAIGEVGEGAARD